MARHHKTVVLEVVVEVDYEDEVVELALEKEWQDNFYAFDKADDVVAYLAWHIGCNGMRLDNMDGWADRPDCSGFSVERVDYEVDDVY